MKRRTYIGLGANQGDMGETLAAAIEALKSLEQSSFVAASPYYVSAPIDAPGPDFLNAVAGLDTELEPYALLLHLQDLERMLGRKRRSGERKNAPRRVDLDLLLMGELIMRSTPLTLPHPRLHERAFVLRPLLDIAPGLAIPGIGLAAEALDRHAAQRVEPFDPAQGISGPATVAPPTTD